MPRRLREYIVSEGQVRIAFLLSIFGGAALLIALLFMMSARPQGRYRPLEGNQFQELLAASADALSTYDRNAETGAITIPIERAMQLVAEQGVANVQFGQAAAQQAQTGEDGQEAGDQDGGPQAGGGQLGEATYASCAGCHQANGQGIPGVFPPLAGHMPEILQAEGGREYLVNVLLYGLQGQISAGGQSYNGAMPAWGQLSDEQVAAVLNHELSSWGNAEALGDFEPIQPDEVAAQRGQDLSPQDVHAQRQELGLE